MDLSLSPGVYALAPLILFEDDDIIVLNKPAGMLSLDDDSGRTSLYAMVKDYLRGDAASDEPVYCAAMHRIDRPVSGVMLFAKNPAAARILSSDMKQRRIRKFYCALTNPAPGTQCNEEWRELRQHIVHRRARTCMAEASDPGALAVAIRYRVMVCDGEYGLVLVELLTGKRHQIRFQLSSIGMPITGDRFYGSKRLLDDGIICLHAHYLMFTHPVTGSPMIITAPLPPHIEAVTGTAPGIGEYLRD
ncbi:MAG: RluA family pseudouridine synthase [Spirochaetes bacterium]|nr:RluA family pseudouridine synthase [Spirochaetota bacterium]